VTPGGAHKRLRLAAGYVSGVRNWNESDGMPVQSGNSAWNDSPCLTVSTAMVPSPMESRSCIKSVTWLLSLQSARPAEEVPTQGAPI
jgi:hypothetical protein